MNLTNCTSTLIGSYSPFGPVEVAVTPNGRLWATVNNSIVEVDTLTGVLSNSVLCGPPYFHNSLESLNDTTLLANGSVNGTQLYKINTNTGIMTHVGNLVTSLNGDLTWYDQHLYGSVSYSLVKWGLNSSNDSIISSATITPVSNTGAYNYGMCTAPFPGEINYIIGSAFNKLVKICPLNGLSVSLCPNIVFPDVISGMAAKRLVTQVPEPSECKGIYARQPEEMSELQIYFTIAPNPCNTNLQINFTRSYENSHVMLFSIDGQLLLDSPNLQVKSLFLDTFHLSSGIYFIQVTLDSKFFFQKLVVQHE